MPMLTQAPKGTQDILPKDSYRWQRIERQMRRVCHLAGYREIRTPIFEHTELFQRGVGDTTDVVQKEMYTFLDKGNRSITLKPEGTAGVVRAMIEAHLYADPLPLKMFYVSCPAFRYEKPQKGRLRQFHQLGVEVFGAKDASVDAEVIRLAMDVLEANGVKGLGLHINSIGCPACRKTYNDALKTFLAPKLPELCETCRGRFERNPMRILDCKEPRCKALTAGAPMMLDMLCGECASHFESLKKYLSALDTDFEIDKGIVRGLDYYTKTVFEVIARLPDGSELTVCGGGRYDGLVEELGGPEMAGIGFGMGVERLVMVQETLGCAGQQPTAVDAFVVTMGEEARLAGERLVRGLRLAGVKADLDHCARSMKAQFKYADKAGAEKVLVLAGDELAAGVVKLRDMRAGTEETVALADIVSRVAQASANQEPIEEP